MGFTVLYYLVDDGNYLNDVINSTVSMTYGRINCLKSTYHDDQFANMLITLLEQAMYFCPTMAPSVNELENMITKFGYYYLNEENTNIPNQYLRDFYYLFIMFRYKKTYDSNIIISIKE